MSPRVTRSSAKQPAQPPSDPQPSISYQTSPPRKRKAPPTQANSEDTEPPPKRKAKSKAIANMSEPKPPPEQTDGTTTTPGASSSSRRRSSKAKKSSGSEQTTPGTLSTSKRTKTPSTKPSTSKKHSVTNKKEATSPSAAPPAPQTSHKNNKAELAARSSPPEPPHFEDDSMDEDSFAGGGLFGRHGGPPGIMNTLRAVSGMMPSSSTSSRMRPLLENMKQRDDPDVQVAAMTEVSTMLLMSNEDTFAGQFQPEPFVKEFIAAMQPPESGLENPQMTLIASQCIANLIEALPQATATVVYGGAVPVLISKLRNLDFIDFAEHALTSLEKISVEFPSSIVREGGLAPCLEFLDFFASGTQRKAVTTAANCCRNIPSDCFPAVSAVMPNLLNVLNSSDQRVVEQGCLCVSRIVESFKYQDSKVEELMNAEILKAILRLLLPSSANVVGSHIQTQFLRVLAITARASPKLTTELFKMNVTDTLYQILTGVSPPGEEGENVAQNIDSVVVMQALIHRPKDQVSETLNVICELLPGLDSIGLGYVDDLPSNAGVSGELAGAKSKKGPIDQRCQMLASCQKELRRFAIVLLPTLTDAFSSTVNLSVRQKVLAAQLKMLSNVDQEILQDALRALPYASYLASILSQQDHVVLVTAALQAAELLLRRLGPIYRYQFYREGVVAEIRKLAESPEPAKEENIVKKSSFSDAALSDKTKPTNPAGTSVDNTAPGRSQDDSSEDDTDHSDGDEEEVYDGGSHNTSSDGASSDDSGRSLGLQAKVSTVNDSQEAVTVLAKRFLSEHENNEEGCKMRERAQHRMNALENLMSQISDYYRGKGCYRIKQLFLQLAKYFEGNALESITSYELLSSNVLQTLVEVLGGSNSQASETAKSAFIQVFMSNASKSTLKISSTKSPTTPFSALIQKLQDLLSRAEPFDVLTVQSSSLESNRGTAASMLSKLLPIRLEAEGEESGMPEAFRSIFVKIHAIATMRSLDEYLRPRIELTERPRPPRLHGSSSRGSSTSSFLAAMASLEGPGGPMRQRLADTAFSPRVPRSTNNQSLPPAKDGRGLTPNSKDSPSAKNEADTSPGGSTKPTSRRRSSRKNKASIGRPSTPPPPPPPPADSETQDAIGDPGLECIEDHQATDDEDIIDEDGALGAIVDELEQGVDEDAPDPSAVNMEVAAGGQVLAREEDGTRVSTPSRLASSLQGGPLPSRGFPSGLSRSLFSRPGQSMSYSAAVQSTPSDWHMEFSVDGKPLSGDTTVYHALTSNRSEINRGRSIWSNTSIINFKRMPGPPSKESSVLAQVSPNKDLESSGLPHSLDQNPTTAAVLRLLRMLHEINLNLDDVLSSDQVLSEVSPEPVAQFVNTKLTAKINRQLEEPLVVASRSLPPWSEDLARLYPFLFPFETRHLFLQSTSFGYSRCLNRWQNAQSSSESRSSRRDDRHLISRLQRQKVRISRARMLESAIKVLELYGSSPSILEVEYFEEVGTGLGPTLEFYSNVSKEFARKKFKLWRENESSRGESYAFGKHGLFPAPMSEQYAITTEGQKVLYLFQMLGKFVARSMLDSRIIDVAFNSNFFRVGTGTDAISPSLGAIKAVDQDLAQSLQVLKNYINAKKDINGNEQRTLQQKRHDISKIEVSGARVEDLSLDFTLPGYPEIELVPNGCNISVTIQNVDDYVEKVIDFTLSRGVRRQVEAFRSGFSEVFQYSALKAFTPDELVMLFGRVQEDWSMETLMDSIKADHGYNLDSRSVRNLLQAMSELSVPARRDFLQFVTGSPKLPIGGFRALTPMLTVVLRPSEPGHVPDEYLPSCMTCVNYLKMPDYSTLGVMKEKLGKAIKEGQGAFHLS